MPAINSEHARLLRQTEPYHFTRPLVQQSNYPRPPQPAIQPNQLEKEVRMRGINPDYWDNLIKEYENETGIMLSRVRKRLNWRRL